MLRPNDILNSNSHYARRNHRFNNTGWQADYIQHCESKGKCMCQREHGNNLDQISPTRHRQHQRANKKKMIVAGDDMCDTMAHERPSHSYPIQSGSTVTLENQGLPESKQRPFAGRLSIQSDPYNVTCLPGISRRKHELPQHILPKLYAFRRHICQPILKPIGELTSRLLGNFQHMPNNRLPVSTNMEMVEQVITMIAQSLQSCLILVSSPSL